MSVGRKARRKFTPTQTQSPRRGYLEPLDRLFRTGTSAGLSDRQLLERFATRHDEAAEAAFEALVTRHGPMVLSVCRRVLSDPNDAHDAFQATFLVLVRRAGAVRKADSLPSWLYGVARRVSFNARAAATRRSIVERSAAAARAVESESKPVTVDREIFEEVDRLPQKLRTLVILCYFEGQTHEQASATLSWPVGTVRSRLARAREILRARLTRRGLAPGSALVPLLEIPAPSLPAPLVDQTIKAAMLFAARDAVEAGLVSASAAALSEGVIRIMLVSKFKSAAYALFAVGAIASGAGVYAYSQDLVRTPEARDVQQIAVNDSDDTVPAKRLSDAEYDSWRDQIADRYKAKMQALLDEAVRHLHDDHTDKAAASTAKLEATAREWRWMMSHPGAKSIPRNFVSSLTQLARPVPDYSSTATYGYVSAAGAPPVALAPTIAPPAPPTPPATPAPGASAPQPVPSPSPNPQPDGVASPSPVSLPAPPAPPAPPGSPAPPATAPPSLTSSDVRPQRYPFTTVSPPAMASPASENHRLDELERKVDRILKALENLDGHSSNTRSRDAQQGEGFSNNPSEHRPGSMRNNADRAPTRPNPRNEQPAPTHRRDTSDNDSGLGR